MVGRHTPGIVDTPRQMTRDGPIVEATSSAFTARQRNDQRYTPRAPSGVGKHPTSRSVDESILPSHSPVSTDSESELEAEDGLPIYNSPEHQVPNNLFGPKIKSDSKRRKHSPEPGRANTDPPITPINPKAFAPHNRIDSLNGGMNNWQPESLLTSSSMGTEKAVREAPKLSVNGARFWMDQRKAGDPNPYLNHGPQLKGKLKARDSVLHPAPALMTHC